MKKNFFSKKGEIGTIITLGVMGVLLGVSLISNFLNQKKQITSTKAVEITCTASANYTCSQICGGYENYVPNSQTVAGALRTCRCKNGCYFSGGGISNISPVITSADDTCYSSSSTNNSCGSSYKRCSDCEKVCGIGQCEQCKGGRWQCKRINPSGGVNLPSCSKPTTYANQENCKNSGCQNCTQCKGVSGEMRYECGGSGPIQCAANQVVCGNKCCNQGEECKNGSCVNNTSTPIPSPNITSSPASSPAPNPSNSPVISPNTTNSPVPNTPIPTIIDLTPTPIDCVIGSCYYKGGSGILSWFTTECPSGYRSTGQKCYVNFGDKTGYQWGTCCINPTPIINTTYKYNQCNEIKCYNYCLNNGALGSDNPDEKVYYFITNGIKNYSLQCNILNNNLYPFFSSNYYTISSHCKCLSEFKENKTLFCYAPEKSSDGNYYQTCCIDQEKNNCFIYKK